MSLKLLSRVKIRGLVPLLLIIILGGEATAQTTLPIDHFEFSTITSPKVGFVPFRVIITAKATNGTTARSFAGTVRFWAIQRTVRLDRSAAGRSGEPEGRVHR